MAEPLVLLSELKSIILPVAPGLSIDGEAVIDRISLTCQMGAVRPRENGVATSLWTEIRYLLATGEVWATEWLQLPVTFLCDGHSWRCRLGPDWCWSTDWPT